MTWTLWTGALPFTLAAMTALWIVSVVKKDAGVVDSVWGGGFVALGAAHAALATTPRSLLVAGLVGVWGLRLSWHLHRRNGGAPEDYRYAAMRGRWGPRFTWVSLGTVFLFQGTVMWLIAGPLFTASRGPAELGPWDAAGTLVFAVGWFFEVVGDRQLAAHRAAGGSGGRTLDTGLWRYTRHPNYFGDALVWWGLYLVGGLGAGAWWMFYAPALMTFFLLRVSGIPLLEARLMQTRSDYADYARRTSAFVPWFPRSQPPQVP